MTATGRWWLRVGALLLAAWLVGAVTLPAQTAVVPGTCSPSDTLRITRQGAALWYVLVDGDTLRHADGQARGHTSEGVAVARGVALRALTRRTIEIHQTYRGHVLGCIPSSPVDGRDSTVVPPAPDSPGRPIARGVIQCLPDALCAGDARASIGDSVAWMAETGPRVGVRLTNLLGPRWDQRTVGSPRTRMWWIVAWSGARADTARVVWTVPVTASTTYPAAPLDSPPAPTGFTWLLIDPRLPGGLITYPGPDSTWTPRQECTTARVVAGLTHWQPTDTLGWSNRFGSLGQTLTACRAVTP